MNIELSRDVAAPAKRVWQVITDLEASPQVISGIESVEILAGDADFGVGTRWKETRKFLGMKATEEIEVTEVDPGRSYVTEADSGAAHYRSTLSVDPVGESSSRLSATFSAEPKGTVGKVLAATVGRVFAGATRKALRQDLDDIAAAAESDA